MATEGMSQYAVILRIKEVKRQLRQRYNPEQLVELYNLIDQLEWVGNVKSQEGQLGSDGTADQQQSGDSSTERGTATLQRRENSPLGAADQTDNLRHPNIR